MTRVMMGIIALVFYNPLLIVVMAQRGGVPSYASVK